jgi:hypothetical protein
MIENKRRAIGCFFGGAMIAAPFVALLYDVDAGLAVLIFTLAAITYLAFDIRKTAPAEILPRLNILLRVNVVLLALCVILFGIRLAG